MVGDVSVGALHKRDRECRILHSIHPSTHSSTHDGTSCCLPAAFPGESRGAHTRTHTATEFDPLLHQQVWCTEVTEQVQHRSTLPTLRKPQHTTQNARHNTKGTPSGSGLLQAEVAQQAGQTCAATTHSRTPLALQQRHSSPTLSAATWSSSLHPGPRRCLGGRLEGTTSPSPWLRHRDLPLVNRRRTVQFQRLMASGWCDWIQLVLGAHTTLLCALRC
jgi:hypothetical protein